MNLPIPSLALEQHILVLGKTGAGKSSVMRLIVEYLLAHEKPVTVIDPKGDWWGLKASASGKQAGYPVVIFGGDHADVPLNARTGAAVAELAATGNRPCIIDLGGWMPGERGQFYIDFAAKFYLATRGHRWLVIDEVHNFAPQGKVLDPQAGKMLHWTNRFASEGRGKGIRLIAASQRPQKVHKDFVTSAETLIAMRVIHPLDRGAIKDWIDGCGDKVKGQEVLDTLALMPRGEGWVWSPEIGFGPKRISFPMFSTYDSFKARSSPHAARLKGWADVNLEEVKTKLAGVVKEAEANDPAKLKARIRELEKQASIKGPIERNVVGGSGTFLKDSLHSKNVERAMRAEANKIIATIHADRKRLYAQGGKLVDLLRQLAETAAKQFATTGAFQDAPKLSGVEIQKQGVRADKAQITAIEEGRVAPPTHYPRPNNSDSRLPVGEKKILIACAQYPDGADRARLTILTGYKRSSRDTYLQRLVQRAYIAISGDKIIATDEGIAVLGSDHQPLPQGEELQKHWLRELPEGERRIFEVLLSQRGGDVDRDALEEATGYKRSSRDTYIQRLIARGIVEAVGRGQVKASAILFE